MSEDEKLKFYAKIIAEITEIGQRYTLHGRINDCYEQFFKERGCSTEEFDFGVITTIITRNSLPNT